MSGHRLELPNTEVRPSRNGKAAQSSSSIRSPSPYHHLDLFDSGSPFEEPLISFDDDNSRTFVAVYYENFLIFWVILTNISRKNARKSLPAINRITRIEIIPHYLTYQRRLNNK